MIYSELYVQKWQQRGTVYAKLMTGKGGYSYICRMYLVCCERTSASYFSAVFA